MSLLILAVAAVPRSSAAPSVTLAWDAHTNSTVAGYRLYYGTGTRAYSANQTVSQPSTTATVTNLSENVTYYFAVTAFTSEGLESDYSDEVTHRVPGTGSNVAPVATAGAVSTSEDQAVGITLSGTDANGDALTYTVVTPPANGVLSGTPPSLTFTPNANFFGHDSLSFRVNDGLVNSVNATVAITVNAVNDPPTLGLMGDVELSQGTASHVVNVTGLGTGATNEYQALTLTATSSNPILVPHPVVGYTSPSATGTLTLRPSTNGVGSVIISVAVGDGVASIGRTFLVTVGGSNNPPSISTISNQTINASTTLAGVPFVVTDAETASSELVVSAISLNTVLVPEVGITLGGTNNNRTISVTPAPGQSGNANIVVTVSDGSRQAQTTFQLTVHPEKSRLTLIKNGNGTITPDLDGQELTVGETYTLTARPEARHVFASWSGDVASATATLVFVMTTDMVIEANFEPDHNLVAQGSYHGLFTEPAVGGLEVGAAPAGIQHESSGNFSFRSTTRGSYSGKLQVGRGKHAIRGLLGRDGRATNIVTRPDQNPLTIELAVAVESSSRITGRVTDGSWIAELRGDRQVYNAKTNPAPFAGSYTLALPPDAGSPAGPDGHGFGTVKIDRNGMATFLGMLADATKVTQKVPLSEEGHWPFYLSLYRGTGSALAWLNLTQAEGQIDGLASWIKPALPCKYYSGGFTNESSVMGSSYVAPSVQEVREGAARRTDVQCFGGNLANAVAGELMVLPNGKLLARGDGSLKFGVTPASGLFGGTVLDPGTGKPRTFRGVMLQKWDVGAGLVIGVDRIGLVEIAQEEALSPGTVPGYWRIAPAQEASE